MKKTILLFFVLGTLILHPAFSQGWEKSYGGTKDDIAYDVIKTSDGGYVAVGSTQSFGAGGTDVFVVKINSSGVLKWTRVIGGTGNDIAYSVAQSTSGDLVIAGVTGSSGAGGKDVYLIRLTANGKTKWIKTFGSTGNDESRAVKFSGNNIYVAGSTTLTGTNSNFYLIKTDGSGNLQWEKNYGLTGTETAYGMTKTFDGGFALAGYTTSYGNNKVYLVKVNANGDTLFTQNYNEASSSGGAAGIAETTDHGLVMTGRYYDGSGYYNAFLLKVSNTGAQVFNKISTALDDNGDNVYATSDGGAIIAGWNGNFGWTMMLIKYDAAGTQQWRNTGYQYANMYSYASFSGGYSVKQVGSGYISVGYTYLPSGSQADFLIVKTDAAGVSYTKPALTAGGPVNFCLPGSVTLTAPAGYSSYQWTYVNTSHGLTYISGNNTPSYTASAQGYYSCIMKNSTNDVIVSSYTYVTANPVPSASISASGPLSYCAGSQTLTLTASPSSYTMFTYQWRLNGADISGANNYTYNPASSSGNYSVVISNSCGSATSANVSVNIAGPPSTPVITGNGSIYATECPLGNTYIDGYLQVAQVTGATYQWYYNGNALGVSAYQTPYINNADYTCTVTTSCGSATSLPVHVSYSVYTVSIPPPTASGPVQGCGAGSVTLSSPYFSNFYQWYKNGVQIAGATSDSYFVTTSGYYEVYFDGPPCGTLSSGIQVTINNSVAASITASGPTSVCSGTVTLNAAPTGAGITYQWYKDNVSISGATAATYAATPSGNYKCNVTQPSCGTSTSNVIYIAIGAPASASIYSSYSAPFCASTTKWLSVINPLPGQTFQWMLNGLPISGATSTTYTTNVAGNYKCDISNACATLSSNTITFVVNPVPPANITSSSTIVCPSIPLALTANSGAGITYQWFNGWNIVSGATQQTYNATSAGNYSVRETAANGCTASSNTITLTAGSLPVVSVTSSQYPEICKNDVITLITNSGAGYTYQWKKNGVNISGATDSLYTAPDSGYYAAEVTNICGSVTSQLYYIKLKSLPPATISPQGPTTFCAGGSVILNANTGTGFSYTWKKNGTNISGELTSSYTATSAGTYKVVVTNNSGCTKTSGGIVVSVPCREGEDFFASSLENIKANIYPNPYNEFFTLFIEGENNNEYLVTIKDVTGKIVREQETVDPGTEIQLGQSLDPGCYLVEIISGEMRKTLKIIKL